MLLKEMYKIYDKIKEEHQELCGNKNIRYFIKREKNKIIKKYYISNY